MAFKAKMDEFLSDVKSSIPAFTLSPSKPVKPPKGEAKKDEKMKIKFLEAWNNFRYDLGSGPALKKDIPIWILGICYHAKASLPEMYDDADEEEVPDFENAPAHAKSVFMDFASRPWFTYRKQFPPIKGTTITSDTGWGCMLRSVQMMIAQGLLQHFLGREWRWLQRQNQHEKHLHRTILGWFVDDPSERCPLSIHHLAEIGRKFGNSPGNWYGPNTVAYITQEAVERAKRSTPELREVAVYVAQDCTVYSGDVYKMCGWDDGCFATEGGADIQSDFERGVTDARIQRVVTEDDYQDSLSTSSASSDHWDENCSETSETSSFVIPAIVPEDTVPAKKATGSSIPMTELFYPINVDVEVTLRASPKSTGTRGSRQNNKNQIAKSHSDRNMGVEKMTTAADDRPCANTHAPEPAASPANTISILNRNENKLECRDLSPQTTSAHNSVPEGYNFAKHNPKANGALDSLQEDYNRPIESLCTLNKTSPCDTKTEIADNGGSFFSAASAAIIDTFPLEPPSGNAPPSNTNGSGNTSPKSDGRLVGPVPADFKNRLSSPKKVPTAHKTFDGIGAEDAIVGQRRLKSNTSTCRAAALILIPVRLGESALNPIYIPCLQEMLSMQSSIGIIGGKPKHSLYFVGFQDENLLHLDPHYCQVADTPAGYKKNLHNYHTMSIRKTNVKKVDPSCCFGFYCPTASDFERFKHEAKRYLSPPEKGMTYPMCLVLDGCSDDHQIRFTTNQDKDEYQKSEIANKEHAEMSVRTSPHKTHDLENDVNAEVRKEVLPRLEIEQQAINAPKSPRKTGARTTDDIGSKLNRFLPDKKFYRKFMRQKSSSPTAKRRNDSQSSLEHEFELL